MMDISQVSCGWRSAQVDQIVEGNAMKIGGRTFAAGLGVHAPSRGSFLLDKECGRFEATVGVDDESFGSVEFKVWGDGKLLWESGRMSARAQPRTKNVKLDVAGVETLVLEVTDAGDGIDGDHADWADARLVYPEGHFAANDARQSRQLGILTPPVRPEPRINGPAVFGVRPDHPLAYHIPVTGEAPLDVQVLAADGRQMQDCGPLAGLRFDPIARVISGRVDKPGTYRLAFRATNARGTAEKPFTLKVGEDICLTPPMGWCSRNASALSHSTIMAAANALAASGLADHGWNTIAIDGRWVRKTGGMQARKADGTILPNAGFPDMKRLTAFLHGRGLRAGICSSPGPCAKDDTASSWMHEFKDAATFADWGFDLLAYDWCDYGSVAFGQGLQRAMNPFLLMGKALRDQKRDMTFAIRQGGRENVATWAPRVRAHCWRTGPDPSDGWVSVANIIARQKPLWLFAGPGAFNDPGTMRFGTACKLLPNEQYTQASLWALLAAPLAIDCDLEQMDDFTRSLLANDEVIEINQDALCRAAACVAADGKREIWARPLADGSIAAGLYNKGAKEIEVAMDLAALGLEGTWRVRDCWRQKDEGDFVGKYSQSVPGHATHLVRLFPQKDARSRLLDVRENAWMADRLAARATAGQL